MIPLGWLATPLGKIGAGCLAAALAYGGYVSWREYQRSVGEAQQLARENAGLLKQEQQAKGYMIAMQALAEHHAQSARQSERARLQERATLRQEIHRYAQATKDNPTIFPPDFVRVFDALGGVRVDAVPGERVPGSGENAAGSSVLPGRGDGGLSDTDVLRAYEACQAQQRKYRDGWQRLTAFDDDRYEQEWRFYTQQHREQHAAAGVD